MMSMQKKNQVTNSLNKVNQVGLKNQHNARFQHRRTPNPSHYLDSSYNQAFLNNSCYFNLPIALCHFFFLSFFFFYHEWCNNIISQILIDCGTLTNRLLQHFMSWFATSLKCVLNTDYERQLVNKFKIFAYSRNEMIEKRTAQKYSCLQML